MLLITGLLIWLGSLDRPLWGRPAVEGAQRRIGGSACRPGDDIIGGEEQGAWTELDEYQLRRLLDS